MMRLALLTPVIFALAVLGLACGDGDDTGSESPTVINSPTPPEGTFAERCQKTDETQFSGPDQVIDETKSYVATIKTEKGDIVVELFSDVPITTNNFVFLACAGYYDGVTFHRVIPDFVAQGGDPTGTGGGGPGYTIPDEDDGGHTFEAGVISMAKSSNLGVTIPDSAGSQFFITYTPQPGLEADFTVFGRVTSGMDDVLRQLTPRDPSVDPNAPPGDIIETITIEER